MQKEAARKLIQETFERAFDKERFKKFVKELLNHLEDAPFTYRGEYIYKDYRDSIKMLERIGKYEDVDGKKIDVLIVHLLKFPSLERARSKQRNFVAKYLKGSRGNELKDGALVAFVSPDQTDWRFSFVKMEYKFDTTKKGRPKVVEEFTPARRYSFLVGEHENSHTAQSQLLPILEDTDHDPTISSIEERFSIEKVTKEFFDNYRLLFYEIKDALDKFVKKDKATKEDFIDKGVDTVDFSKKLLGQIVFLYFLQKKGWFGVARNDAWGTGPKNFLRLLFEGKMSKYDNFFNDILEPLFYEALAVERQADYYSPFKCKIPFLNGGLFDPLNDYDWVHTDILLPDELFSNKNKTKQGDIGTGILDVFDRYNFTVKEDEPLEKEVAVDPEMLGKVFENLLEVKDRKSKGTYYTPREIVHYMCQESLINYLATELKDQVNREDIETLIKHGELALENDALVSGQGEEKGRYKYKLPKSIREHNELIDQKLADIKVCDPAVGSGAFLVGMMSEIVRTRSVLARLNDPDQEPDIYGFKRDAIQESLHGVDIDLGAVEIAKLRLWLSLIVDEDNYKHIKPLPNLDYKIMQGNSLLEEYEGIKLIDERFFKKHEEKEQLQQRLKDQQSNKQREYFNLHSNNKLTATKKSEIEKELKRIEKQLKALEQPQTNGQDPFDMFGKTEAQSKAEKLLELHEQFFGAHHKSDKVRLQEKIDALTWELIEATLKRDGKTDKLEDIKKFQKTNTTPFFLWKLNFADVFREKNGFDVVIANPPYGIVFDAELKAALEGAFSSFKRNNDIYVSFIEQGFELLRDKGRLTYITPNTFLNGDYYKKLREMITSSSYIQEVIDYKEHPIFDDPTVFVSIIGAIKSVDIDYPYKFTLRTWQSQSKHFTQSSVLVSASDESEFKPSDPILTRLKESANIQMIDELFFVKDVGFNYWTKGRGKKRGNSIGSRVLYSGKKKSSGDIAFIKGRDISPYHISHPSNYLKNDYEKHINPEVDTFRFSEGFLTRNPKIVYRQTASRIIAALDVKANYCDKTVHLIVPRNNITIDLRYLLALLNSSLMQYLYSYISQERAGRTFSQVKTTYIKKLPVLVVTKKEQDRFITIIDQILEITGNGTYSQGAKNSQLEKLQKKLDKLVCELYDLSIEEIAIVEGEDNG